MSNSLDEIVAVIKTVRISKVGLSEKCIVDEIVKVLNGYCVSREVKLGPGCRVDLMVEPGIAIEVKKGKPNSRKVASQIRRYAEFDSVDSIILVSERGLYSHLTEANGKPARYVSLALNWGIAV